MTSTPTNLIPEELKDTEGLFSCDLNGEISQSYFLLGMCFHFQIGGLLVPFVLWLLPGKLFESNLGNVVGDVIYTVGVQELRVTLVFWYYLVWMLLFTLGWGSSLYSRRLNRLQRFGYLKNWRSRRCSMFVLFVVCMMPFIMFPHGALIFLGFLFVFAMGILVCFREREEEAAARLAYGDGELCDTDGVTRYDKEETPDGSESTNEIHIGGRDPSPTVPEYNEDTIMEVPNEHLLPMAEAGDILAQFELGRRFFEGRGCLKNSTRALRWLYKARENGSASAKAYIKENLEN